MHSHVCGYSDNESLESDSDIPPVHVNNFDLLSLLLLVTVKQVQ